MITLNPRTDALVVVDAQPTFMPGGGLAVPEGDQIIPVIKRLMLLFPREVRFATKDRHKIGSVSLASSFVGLQAFHRLTYEEFLENFVGLLGNLDTLVTDTEIHIENDESDNSIKLSSDALFGLEELKGYLKQVKYQTLWPDHALEGTEEAELHPQLPERLFEYVQVKGLDPICDSYSGFRDALGRPTGLGELVRMRGITRAFYVGLCGNVCVGHTANDGMSEGIEGYMIKDATRDVLMQELTDEMDSRFAKTGVRVITSDMIKGW
ncbi:MAG: isochorismatase family protein [Candidatus Doudnabacteria bacterium]|nr:isochorismatase family protein [Candidatus Doudnabacteria bacterium]